MSHSQGHEHLDSLPLPLQKMYRVFWGEQRSPHRRPMTNAEIDERLKSEQVYDYGDVPGDACKSLLNLSPEELSSAMADTAYWDGQQYFKQLLARAFELAWAEGGALPPYAEIRLLGYGWRNWPTEEREAIEASLLFIWEDALQKKQPDAACAIGLSADEIGAPLVPLFEAWRASGAPCWVLHLGSFERWEEPSLERDWLLQPWLLARVEAEFFAAEGAGESDALSQFHDFLLWLRAQK